MGYLSVFCPNAIKYGPEKLRIWNFSRSVSLITQTEWVFQVHLDAIPFRIFGCKAFFSKLS